MWVSLEMGDYIGLVKVVLGLVGASHQEQFAFGGHGSRVAAGWFQLLSWPRQWMLSIVVCRVWRQLGAAPGHHVGIVVAPVVGGWRNLRSIGIQFGR